MTKIENKFKQSGLTVAITSPVISAVQTAQQMSQAASDTNDSRMKVLAAANIGFAGKNAVDAINKGQGPDADAAQKAGGINISVSIGSSQSQNKTVQTSDSVRVSTVTAGNNLNITAIGAGRDSDITVQGSTLKAGNRVVLNAQDEIRLLAAKNTADQHSTNSSTSGSIGISYGTNGFLVNASASGARGKADGSDVTWSNTHVNAGNQVSMISGGDTTLKGAVVQAPQITAKVGGNLNVESLQDTSKFDSKQQSIGGSVSVGAGKMSGSVNLSKSQVKSDFASVTEESGFRAGDGGFNITVARNTDLKGGVISSTDQAVLDGKNSLTTATLTQSDIKNYSNASATSSGINLSRDMLTQGKYGLATAVIGNGLKSSKGSDASTGVTRSAIQGATVNITDDAAQQALTGKTAAQTVASINTDTANAQTGARKLDLQAMERTVQAEQAIKTETIKTITVFTDEAYRSRFEEKPVPFKVTCSSGVSCDGDPSKLVWEHATVEDLKNAPAGAVLAVNGILNDEKRAVELGYQNIEPLTNLETGIKEKPITSYLMHIRPAKNTISELLAVAYENITASTNYGLANFLGYTNGDEQYAELLRSRPDKATTSLGHSRGTLVQEAAFTILANRPDADGNTYTNPDLTVRGFAGAANAENYSAKAAQVQGPDGNKNKITFNYFSNDPVSVTAGGNPGEWRLKDLVQVFATDNSMHSCGGTGAVGCTQVEFPMPGGPQGTPEGNAQLIRYKAGEKVEDVLVRPQDQGRQP